MRIGDIIKCITWPLCILQSTNQISMASAKVKNDVTIKHIGKSFNFKEHRNPVKKRDGHLHDDF